MYLLDTNVISELREPLAKVDANVLAWSRSVDIAVLFLSPVTLMELEMGVLRLERHDPAQSTLLRGWLDEYVIPTFKDRVLPIDRSVAMRCARLHIPNPCSDHDAWIAATALEHGMTVVTRNIGDFARTGVRLLNPWDPQVS